MRSVVWLSNAKAFLRTALFALQFASTYISDPDTKALVINAKELVEEALNRVESELREYICEDCAIESDTRAREIIRSVIASMK